MGRSRQCLVLLFCVVASAKGDEAARLIPLLGTDQARNAAEELADLGVEARSAVPALTEALRSGDPEVQWRAAWALARIGPEAAPAAPDLVRIYDGRGLPSTAARLALVRIGRGATPAIVAALQKAPAGERTSRVSFLGTMELDPAIVVPLLVELVKGDGGPDRDACAVLESMKADAAPAVPALAAALRDFKAKPFVPGQNLASEGNLLDALVAIGEPSVGALGDLARSTSTPLARRGEVIGALMRVGGSGLRPARDCLGVTPEWAVVQGIVRNAAEAGPRTAPLAADLGRVIEATPDPPAGSARALLSLGDAGVKEAERILFAGRTDARVSLIRQLDPSEDDRLRVSWALRLAKPTEHAAVRQEAFAALARLHLDDAQAREAVKLAQPSLKEERARVVSEACRLAGHAGRAGASLVARLRPLLKHRDPYVRAAAASALCELGKGGSSEAGILGSVFQEAASADDWRLHWYAVECLVSAGRPAASQYQLLLNELKGDNDFLRFRAAEGLGRMLPAVGGARTPILAALREAGRHERRCFARGLACAPDVEGLMGLLTDEDADDEAVNGLVANGAQAWRMLTKALDDANPRIRRLAAQALLRIDMEKADPRACLLSLGDDPYEESTDVGFYRMLEPVPTAALLPGLTSANATTRCRAAVILGDLRYRDALPQLWKLVKDDPETRVRMSALSAVDRLLQVQE